MKQNPSTFWARVWTGVVAGVLVCTFLAVIAAIVGLVLGLAMQSRAALPATLPATLPAVDTATYRYRSLRSLSSCRSCGRRKCGRSRGDGRLSCGDGR